MPQFSYAGLQADGEVVRGQVEAGSRREAFTRLRELGVHPTQLSGQAEAAAPAVELTEPLPRSTRVSRAEVAFLTRQLADLVGAGLPLHRSLDVVCAQAVRRGVHAMLADLQEEVSRGSAFSAALERHGAHFPLLYRQMVAAGEASGHLDQVLMRLAEFLEREQERRTQLLSAFTYPLVLVCMAAGAVVFLMTFLVPRLGMVFADINQELPLPTRILLATANFVGGNWVALVVGAAATLVIIVRLARSRPGRRALDALALRLPILGVVTSRAAVSRFARALGTMVDGGVPILQALEVAAGASGNVHITEWVVAAAERVRQGVPVHTALAEAGSFPPTLVQMTAVGEETGTLARMLGRVADAFDFEVDQRLRRLTTLLEPAIIVCMGCLVGFIVLSILLPIFQINATIR